MTYLVQVTKAIQSLPPDHLEPLSQMTQGISALTIDPYKNAIYYFFPFLWAWFSYAREIKYIEGTDEIFPKQQTELLRKEIKELTECAGIKGEVNLFSSLTYRFWNCGGRFSITSPIILVPDRQFFSLNGYVRFSEDQQLPNPSTFTDDQVRFLLARELAQIKKSDSLYRLAVKTAILVSFWFICASSLNFAFTIFIILSSLGIYLISERKFHAQADLIAIEILQKRGIKDPNKIALSTLEKLKTENILRRKSTFAAQFYISEVGNNWLDITYPSLENRIKWLTATG